MSDSLVIALAQTNPTVGDIAGNIAAAKRARAAAAAAGADLVVLGELVVSGYPPEDLVLKPAFMDAVEAAVTAFAAETDDDGPGVLLGTPWRMAGKLYNAAVLLEGGKIAHIRRKYDLPNYRVFDEKRVFTAGPLPGPVPFRGVRLGVMICEDMWTPDVAECLEESGAEMILSIHGSPFDLGKEDERLGHAVARVTETGLPLVCLNIVGGQDELIFDGSSFVLNADRSYAHRLKSMTEDFALTRWQRGEAGWACAAGTVTPSLDTNASIYHAMVLGLRDYVQKNGFPGVLLGLSGGIDSALSAAVAVDALGPDAVHCVMMPSPYTSQDSLDDAAACAAMLGCKLDTINIGPAMAAFEGMLAPLLSSHPPDITEENIQSRSRGLTLMALSNKLGAMVLSTGNKSEMSVGYATLYGDMCGGYSVLKDVYKTTVFAISNWRNAHHPDGMRHEMLGPDGPVMPDRIITKPPTAELKPDQTDQDTLPPYDILDAILEGLIEDERTPDDLVAAGHDHDLVLRIWRMLDRAEYKRRQAPPGVKITRRAFGRDRRYPITNRFQGAV